MEKKNLTGKEALSIMETVFWTSVTVLCIVAWYLVTALEFILKWTKKVLNFVINIRKNNHEVKAVSAPASATDLSAQEKLHSPAAKEGIKDAELSIANGKEVGDCDKGKE